VVGRTVNAIADAGRSAYWEETEMSISPKELTNTATPSVRANSDDATQSPQVVIRTQQVLLGTAAARGAHRNQTGGRFGGILWQFFPTSTDESRRSRHDKPRRYGFLEDAEVAREMFRL
jgi:hypothetical protein